jgi:hypothetical protein
MDESFDMAAKGVFVVGGVLLKPEISYGGVLKRIGQPVPECGIVQQSLNVRAACHS